MTEILIHSCNYTQKQEKLFVYINILRNNRRKCEPLCYMEMLHENLNEILNSSLKNESKMFTI